MVDNHWLCSTKDQKVTAVAVSSSPALVLSASWRGELKLYNIKVRHCFTAGKYICAFISSDVPSRR